jgi:hypothetical protein
MPGGDELSVAAQKMRCSPGKGREKNHLDLPGGRLDLPGGRLEEDDHEKGEPHERERWII